MLTRCKKWKSEYSLSWDYQHATCNNQ